MSTENIKQKSVLWPILKQVLIFALTVTLIIVGTTLVANVKLNSIGLGSIAQQFGMAEDVKIKDIFSSLRVLNSDPEEIKKDVVQQVIPATTGQVEEKLSGSSFGNQPGKPEQNIQSLLEPNNPVIYPTAKTIEYTDAQLASVIRSALSNLNFSLKAPQAPGAMLMAQTVAETTPSVSDIKLEILEVSFKGSTVAGNAVCRVVIEVDISAVLPLVEESIPASLRSFVTLSPKYIVELLINVEQAGNQLVIKDGAPLQFTINNSPETTGMLISVMQGYLDVNQLKDFIKTNYGQKVCNLVNNLGIFVSIENGVITLTTRTA